MQIIIIRINVCIGRIDPQRTISLLIRSALLELPLMSRLGAFDTQFFCQPINMLSMIFDQQHEI